MRNSKNLTGTWFTVAWGPLYVTPGWIIVGIKFKKNLEESLEKVFS